MIHSELEVAQEVLSMTETAIKILKELSAKEQRITHDLHPSAGYTSALKVLDLKVTGERSRVSRLKAINR